MTLTLPSHQKVLIGRTIQYTSMIFYFTIAFWTVGDFGVTRKLQITWGILMVIGLGFILIGKYQERKEKPTVGTSADVSLRLN